jgi:hypothetical protein
VEDNLVVAGIFLVQVLEPLDRGSMDLDISTVCDRTDLDGGVAEIRSAVCIERSNVNDAHGLAVGGYQAEATEVLIAPDVAKKTLMNVELAIAHM